MGACWPVSPGGEIAPARSLGAGERNVFSSEIEGTNFDAFGVMEGGKRSLLTRYEKGFVPYPLGILSSAASKNSEGTSSALTGARDMNLKLVSEGKLASKGAVFCP